MFAGSLVLRRKWRKLIRLALLNLSEFSNGATNLRRS